MIALYKSLYSPNSFRKSVTPLILGKEQHSTLYCLAFGLMLKYTDIIFTLEKCEASGNSTRTCANDSDSLTGLPARSGHIAICWSQDMAKRIRAEKPE
jgi:hypothetical protein